MLSLRLFGGASLQVEGASPGGEARQTRRLALLALLATDRTGAMTRAKLIGYLWPETGEEKGRHRLSESLYVLRKSLGAQAILSEGEIVRVNPQLVACDVMEFEAAIERGDLERAVLVYTGPFLDGFYVRDAVEFERWVEAERRRLADSYAAALEQLAETAEAAKDHVGAVANWNRLGAHDPYNSRYVLRLMQAMVAAGDPANAIQASEEHARVLGQDLGMEPPSELVHFAHRLRAGAIPKDVPQLDRAAPAASVDRRPPEKVAAGGEEQAAPVASLRRRLTRSVGFAVVGALGISAVVALLWFAFLRERVPEVSVGAPVDAANRIAVLPFTYRGGDESALLGEAISDLLTTTLDEVGGLRTVDARAVRGVAAQTASDTGGSDQARSVALRLGAGRYVTGDVVELFGQLQISARIFAVDGELGAEGLAATAQGSTDEYFAVIDDLTRQLLLHAVGPAREYDRLAARTTDSLSALKAYLEGAAEVRAERYRSAFAAFQRAVRIDSTFALAWYGMFWAGAWPGLMEWEQAMEATRQAVRYSGRLPARVQGVMKANSANMHGDLAEGERLSRAVLTRYPNYPDAWYALGFALWHWNPFHGRPISEAFVTYKRCLSLEPDNSHFQYAGALVAALEGDWPRFDSLSRVVETRPAMALSWRAIRAFGAGSEAEQAQVLAEARQLADWQPHPAGRYVSLFAGDVAGGAELVSLANLESLPLEARGIARVQVAEFMLAVGRWRAAQRELAQVATLNPSLATLYRALWATTPWVPATRPELSALHDSVASWEPSTSKPSVTHTGTRAHDLLGPHVRLYTLGRLALRLGDHGSALGYADQLEAMANPRQSPSYGYDRARTIRAYVLRDRGRLAEALEVLGSQRRRLNIQYLFDAPFYVHPEERFLHGEIMVGLERYEEALGWYDAAGQVGFGEPGYVAMAHFRRGQVHERLGDTGSAAYHYKKFVRYWQDADPEFQPWVEAARRALERLFPEN